MIAKVVGGSLAVGILGTVGVAIVKPEWLGSDSMPEWHSLSEDKGFDEANYEDKLGKQYKNYLTGSSDKNQYWWEWSYRRLVKEETREGQFSNVDGGYGTKDSLSKVCELAYKKSLSELKEDTDENIEYSDFKRSDVFKYCSPRTTDVSKDNYWKDRIGGERTNKTTLVSTKDESNNWFWEARNKDFWSTSSTSSTWSGSTATGDNDDKSLFKVSYEAGKNNEIVRKNIKEICEKSYSLDINGKSNNDDAKKFCSL